MKLLNNALSPLKDGSKNQFEQQIRSEFGITLPYVEIIPVRNYGIDHVIEQILFSLSDRLIYPELETDIITENIESYLFSGTMSSFVGENGEVKLMSIYNHITRQFHVVVFASSVDYYEYILTMILLQCSDALNGNFPLRK